MPTVSIGIPVYNGERFLEEALRSILAQTYTDFELLISDNASTDGTMAVIDRCAAGDERVIVQRNAVNVGAAANYNLLVKMARGRYFKWAAHDDTLAPTYLERSVAALEQHPDRVLCYPTTVMIDEQGAPTGNDPWERINSEGVTAHERLRSFLEAAYPRLGCNAVFGLIRTDALRATRLIGGYASSDKILLGELVLLGKFLHLAEPLFFRREHAGSSVRAHRAIEARNLWFDTIAPTGSRFMHWKWVGEYLRGVFHVPLPLVERLRCSLVLRQYMVRNKDRLLTDLKQPLRSLRQRVGLKSDSRGS